MAKDNKLCIQIDEFSDVSGQKQITIESAVYVEIRNIGTKPVVYTTSSGQRTIQLNAIHQYFGTNEYLIQEYITFNFSAGPSIVEVIQTRKYEKE